MKTILVVDDDKTNLVIAKQALGKMYNVIALPSGRAALKYLGKNTCDMILLDVDMPAMDGIETLKIIREMKIGMLVPVMFLTADKSKETVIEGATLGIVGYITKPYTYDALRSRIADIFKNTILPLVLRKSPYRPRCHYE